MAWYSFSTACEQVDNAGWGGESPDDLSFAQETALLRTAKKDVNQGFDGSSSRQCIVRGLVDAGLVAQRKPRGRGSRSDLFAWLMDKPRRPGVV